LSSEDMSSIDLNNSGTSTVSLRPLSLRDGQESHSKLTTVEKVVDFKSLQLLLDGSNSGDSPQVTLRMKEERLSKFLETEITRTKASKL
jgi:hypothetical protein